MELLIITAGYPSVLHPDEYVFLRNTLRAIAREGHQLTVINPVSLSTARFRKLPERASLETCGQGQIRVFRPRTLSFSCKGIGRLNSVHLTNAAFNRTVAREVRRVGTKPDAVYGHFLYQGGYAAAMTGERLRVPAIVGVGEGEFWTIRPVGSARARIHFKQTGMFVAVSSRVARDLEEELRVPAERIRVLPNGIDRSLFSLRDRKESRSSYRLPQDLFIIGFVGTFNHLKGGERLLEAVSDLTDTGVLLVGHGPLALDSQRVLFKGRVPHDELPSLLAAADIFVLPTLVEGCSNAVLEAMGCGLPIITAKGEYMDDIVDDRVAIRVDPLDVAEIRGAILALKNDPVRRRQMSQACLKKARLFDIEERATKLLSWIEELRQA